MKGMMLRLWRDDEGIVALEYLLVATVVGLGLVVGLAALNEALTAELTELSNAILALDQSYAFVGFKAHSQHGGLIASRNGSAAIDHYSRNNVVTVPPAPARIDVVP
jgi:Flp pilus assembly pilin Flp